MIWNGPEQNLESICEARDRRAAFQTALTEQFKCSVVAYKLNIPGPIKFSEGIKQIFEAGLAAFKSEAQCQGVVIGYERIFYEYSGPEFFAVCDAPPEAIKTWTSNIENTHFLGRLFDFDVIGETGEAISRQDLGQAERRCLICDQPAFACGRARNHDLKTLQNRIETLHQSYCSNID